MAGAYAYYGAITAVPFPWGAAVLFSGALEVLMAIQIEGSAVFGKPVGWWLLAKEVKWDIAQVNKLFSVACYLRLQHGWLLSDWASVLTELESGW